MTEDDDDFVLDPTKSAEWLRDEILRVMRQEQVKPWKDLNENEQEWVAARIEQVAKSAVGRIAMTIATAPREAIGATMGKLGTDKNGQAETKITFQTGLNDDQKLAIWGHINRNVVVVLMDVEEYQRFETRVKITKDQPDLPLEETDSDAEQVPEEFTIHEPAPQRAPGQPDWDRVGEKLRADEEVRTGIETDAPDAHEAIDEDVPPPEHADDLVEDDEELAQTLNIPNPTAPKSQSALAEERRRAAAAMAPEVTRSIAGPRARRTR